MTSPARALSGALAALALAASGPAQAQQIVHDPTSYAKLVEETRTALEQLRALQAQIEQGQALYDSFNDLSDVNRLAEGLGLAQVRNPLPDLEALRAAAGGDLSALGTLADRAGAILDETRPDAALEATRAQSESDYRESLERAGARAARDLALGEAVDRAAQQRRDGLETLKGALDQAPNARAVMDLQARLAAEQALIGNEQIRMQALAISQAAEARLEEQRARQQAEAARQARMAAYQRTFQ